MRSETRNFCTEKQQQKDVGFAKSNIPIFLKAEPVIIFLFRKIQQTHADVL
jgi:hypothetical protein